MSAFFRKTQPLFIGLCAACMAAQTLFLLEKSPALSNQYPLFIGLLTVFGYHFMSKSPSKKVVAWLAGLAAAIVFLKNQWPMDRLQVGLCAVAASYYFPAVRQMFFGKNAPLRISTFGKPASIALVWSAVTVVPPFLFFEKTGGIPALFLMLAGRFCFVGALALGYDLIDEKADRAAGLPTVPVRFGVFFTKKVMLCLLLAAIVPVAGQVASGFYSIKTGAAVAFSLGVAAFLTRSLPTGRAAADAKMLVDAMMVLQFLAVAAAVSG